MSSMEGTNDRALWLAVIAQAMEDASAPLPGTGSGDYKARCRYKRDAREYFARLNPNLRRVCALAGLEPEAVQALALERIRLADDKQATKTKPPKPVKAKTKIYEHDGLSLTINEWAKRSGLRYSTLAHRIRSGWPMEHALKAASARGKGKGKRTAWSAWTFSSQAADGAVPSDLADLKGTGAGSTAQDSANIVFQDQR